MKTTREEVAKFLKKNVKPAEYSFRKIKKLREASSSTDPAGWATVRDSDIKSFLRNQDDWKETHSFTSEPDYTPLIENFPLTWEDLTSLRNDSDIDSLVGRFPDEKKHKHFRTILRAILQSNNRKESLTRANVFDSVRNIETDKSHKVSRQSVMMFLKSAREKSPGEKHNPRMRGYRGSNVDRDYSELTDYLKKIHNDRLVGARPLYKFARQDLLSKITRSPTDGKWKRLMDALSRRAVESFVRKQEITQIYRPRRKRKHTVKPTLLKHPFLQFGIDIADMQNYPSFKDTSNQFYEYKYILVMIDLFSKYGYATPLLSKSTQSVQAGIDRLVQQIMDQLKTCKAFKFGNDPNRPLEGTELFGKKVTITVRGDREATLTGLNSRLKKRWGIKTIQSLPGKPWSNGQVEKLNGIIKQRLFKHMIMSDSGRSWHRHLDDVLNVYNNSVQSTVKFTPTRIVRSFLQKGSTDAVVQRVYQNIRASILRTMLHYKHMRPLSKGTLVRIPIVMDNELQKKKSILYNQVFSKDVYEIARVNRSKTISNKGEIPRAPTYIIRLAEKGVSPSSRETIKRTFYRHELRVVPDGTVWDNPADGTENALWEVSKIGIRSYRSRGRNKPLQKQAWETLRVPSFEKTSFAEIAKQYRKGIVDDEKVWRPYRSVIVQYKNDRGNVRFEPRVDVYETSKKMLQAWEKANKIVWMCGTKDNYTKITRIFAHANPTIYAEQVRYNEELNFGMNGVWFYQDDGTEKSVPVSTQNCFYGFIENEKQYTKRILSKWKNPKKPPSVNVQQLAERMMRPVILDERSEYAVYYFDVLRPVSAEMEMGSRKIRKKKKKTKKEGFVVRYRNGTWNDAIVEKGTPSYNIAKEQYVANQKPQKTQTISLSMWNRNVDYKNKNNSKNIRKTFSAPAFKRISKGRNRRRVVGYVMKYAPDPTRPLKTQTCFVPLSELKQIIDDRYAREMYEFNKDHSVDFEKMKWLKNMTKENARSTSIPSSVNIRQC